MNNWCTKNIMPLNSISAVNTNKHNVASPWCLWVAWAIPLVVHFSLNLSYRTIRKKTFVLIYNKLGYTECCMSHGCSYRRWFPRALLSKMLLSIWALCLMVMLSWEFFNSHKRTPVNRAYSQSDLEQALLLSLTGGSCKESSSLSFAIARAAWTTERQGACRLKKGILKTLL
jgi:hypothetical protein